MKLLALGVQRERRIKRRREDLCRHTKLLEERLPQPFEEVGIGIAYRERVQLFHWLSTVTSSF